jgi:cytochrome P450
MTAMLDARATAQHAKCTMLAALLLFALQLHDEQVAVIAEYGDTLTPDAYKAMPYAMAVTKETLRLAQIVAYVPRMATKDLPVPGGPTLSAGCPFLVALSVISRADPALQQAADQEEFRPER